MTRLAHPSSIRSFVRRPAILLFALAAAAPPAWTKDAPFRRGDANGDGNINLPDAVAVIMDLFSHDGIQLPCKDAADANDDGRLNVTDPIFILFHLFRGENPFPAPSEKCGPDPTPDDLGCESFPSCPIEPGDPLPGLSEELLDVFRKGEADFLHRFTPGEGLGPMFIETSCGSCHSLGGIGGADSLADPNHLVRRFATTTPEGAYNPLASLGGDVWQTRSIAGMAGGCEVAPEVEPAEATIHSVRNPIPLFGDGLIQAVPDSEILDLAIDMGDGVHGRPNLDPAGKPGRFGWKAQGLSLLAFNATAFNATMGITTPQSLKENLPQGKDIPPECADGAVGASTPNDPEGKLLVAITDWALLLAPPNFPDLVGEAKRGHAVFEEVGCMKCHNQALKTGPFSLTLPSGETREVAALSNQTLDLFSDLLLHDMGPELDDQVVMRQAKGSEFRTAPLWGLGLRQRFLHDGRTDSLDEAIRAHGGEAHIIRDRYAGLPQMNRDAILAFLKKL